MDYNELLVVIDAVSSQIRRENPVDLLYEFVASKGVGMPKIIDFPGPFCEWVIEACKRLDIKDGPPWSLKLTTVLRKQYKAACDHLAAVRGPNLLALERIEKVHENGVLNWLDWVEKQVRRGQSVHLMGEWLMTTYGYSWRYQQDVSLALGLDRKTLESLYGQDLIEVTKAR
jgi:hypothetical protein